MSEDLAVKQSADVDNKLIRSENAVEKKDEKPAIIYDASLKHRLEFDVRDGVKVYETAHVFNPLGDERYMQWQREFKIKGTEGSEETDEHAREASVRLWDELIASVEKIKYPEGTDFRTLIPPLEKLEALNAYLSVAIGEDLEHVDGDRVLGENSTQTVLTECFFNGGIATQQHELKRVSLEWQKKYSRIQAKRFKRENIGGLRRKAKIEFVPQDDKFGELYDEMFVSQTGFANGQIPLRFKTLVIDHLFQEKLDQKKSQR